MWRQVGSSMILPLDGPGFGGGGCGGGVAGVNFNVVTKGKVLAAEHFAV